MKNSKFAAFLFAAALTASAMVSCSDSDSSSSDSNTRTVQSDNQGDNNSSVQQATRYSPSAEVADTNLGIPTELNDTVFTLNSVVDGQCSTVDGYKFIYLDVTIKNNTSKEYELNSLNNFFIELPDGSTISSDIRPKMYAITNFSKASDDPVTLLANGEYSGFMAGGFLVPDGIDSFTVGFIPTQDNAKDKTNVIKIAVQPSDITIGSDSMK